MNDSKVNSTELLTVQEVANALKISPRTIYNRVAPGSKNPFPIMSRKLGGSIRFLKSDLEKFIKGE